MNYPINKNVIIRTSRAGVFYGTLSEYDEVNSVAEIKDCRRLWYWSGAASLNQLAIEGVKNPNACKFTVTVPLMQVMEVIEIIPCTADAIRNIERVEVWKM